MLPEKDPDEIIDIPFNFAREVGNAVIVGTPVFYVSIYEGADLEVNQIPHGAMTMQGNVGIQRIKLGKHGVTYRLRAVATLNDGRRITRGELLPVHWAGRE